MFKVNELLAATGGRLISGKKDAAVKGISIDSRTVKPAEAFIAIKGDNFDGHNFIIEAVRKGSGCIIAENRVKGLESRNTVFIEVKDTIKALGDIARYHRQNFNIPIIAITGSTGKTTTKEMASWVLAGSYKVLKNEGTENNHIGLPLTILRLDNTYNFAVLELGTNNPKEMEYLAGIAQPNVAIITNIGPAHLEHFGNLEGVLKEKYSLVGNLKKPYIAILNIDCPLLGKKIKDEKKEGVIFTFGINNAADFQAQGVRIKNGKIEFLLNKKNKFRLKALGSGFTYNALAAAALGRISGLGYKEIIERLRSFSFPQGRLNLLEVNRIRFIDDTYNSNPASLKQALEAMANLRTEGRKIFVMGDMLELGSDEGAFHRQAVKDASRVCDIFITVGSLTNAAIESIKSSGLSFQKIFNCKSSSDARDILFKEIGPKQGDVVLVKGSRAMKMEEIFKI